MEESVQLSLPLMPAKIEELYIDQVHFLPFMYSENSWKFEERFHLKSSSEMRKMDSDYCHRVRSQIDSPETVKKKLLNNVALAEKMWKDYFKKNARIYESKHGTLTFIDDTTLEKKWKETEKETEKMLKSKSRSSKDVKHIGFVLMVKIICFSDRLYGHVDHADANAAFNIAVWPLIDPLHTERDVCKGNTDAPQCGIVISSRKAA
jgi:hypothetical protein